MTPAVDVDDIVTYTPPLIVRGRYQIVPEGGDKPVPHTRVTNFAKKLEDGYTLTAWKQRNVLIGAAQRSDVIAATLAAGDDKRELDRLAEVAMDAAKANVGRETGTALHTLTEQVDSGMTVDMPSPWREDIEAYSACMAELGATIQRMEEVVVLPDMGLAGRFDRLVEINGSTVVMDLKGLAVDTPIPTPSGFSTMGSLSVGDEVFDSAGNVCRVTAKSDVHWRDCYRIVFDDTSAVIADGDHRWPISSGATKSKPKHDVLTTKEIADTLLDDRQRHHRIVNAGPLDLPEADLPIHPYVLGAWLGDGNRSAGVITKPLDHALWDELKATGVELGKAQIDKRSGCATFTVLGLVMQLKANHLFRNKHIPAAYLRGSFDQRLALLQGLMDTDWTFHKTRHQAIFNNTDKELARGVYELVVSLGQRALLDENMAFGFGKSVTCYNVRWVPKGVNPFRARKVACADRLNGTAQSGRRLIKSVDRIPTVPTQCIQVDSPDHTYLCTESMIPTHNTGSDLSYSWMSIAIQLALYAQAKTVYDPVRQTHEPMPHVDQQRGLVVHLPAGKATATAYWVDLAMGRKGIDLTKAVLNWRKTKGVAQPAGNLRADMRGYVIDRVRAIIDAGHGEKLASVWPDDVPPLKASDAHTEAQYDEILAVCALVEGLFGMPFPESSDPRVVK